MGRTKWLTGAALIVFTAAAYPSYAVANTLGEDAAQEQSLNEQDAQEGGLNVIVVTAQRRQESVQDIPIAISAFDSAELQTRGVSNALEVTQFVPNFVGINNTGLGSANAYYLRGLGNTESIATFDPPIGTYLDDIYLSRQNANNLSLFDVERVEVLRGPQGTLFGRNTTGGAVAVFLKEPEDRVGGYGEVGYGSYQQYTARGSVDVPLADSFAVKVSGYFQDDRGYAKNTSTGERLNYNDGWGVRLGLRGELSENARWTGSYIHTFSDSANLTNFDCDPANPSNCDGRFITTGLTKNSNFGGRLSGEKDNYGLGVETTMDFISSNLELGDRDFSVNIITGYVYTTQDFALDFADGRALPSINTPFTPVLAYKFGGFTVVNEGEFSQFSQEIKVNASLADGLIDLVGGVYYFEESNYTDLADVFSVGQSSVAAPGGIPLILADRTVRNSTKAYAGYLQGDLNLTDQLKLTAGVRYTDETKTFSVSDNKASCRDGSIEATCIDNMNLFAPNGRAIPRKQNIKIWTPRFAVNFQATNDLLLYASATRGFKSGGWNARGLSASELLPFDAEKAWSYEAGLKTELFDRRLRFNLAGYWLDVAKLQTPTGFTRLNGAIGFVTSNFADYRNKGIELEINAAPVDGLNLFASLGYQDDKYIVDLNNVANNAFGVQSVASQLANCQAQIAAGLVPGGDATACGQGIVAPNGQIGEPVRSPKFNISLGASYKADLGGGLTLTPAVNANWLDKLEVGTNNITFYDDPVTSSAGPVYNNNTTGQGARLSGSATEARWIVNGTLTLRSEQGWSLSAECRNCFDEKTITSTLANVEYLNAPRSWLVKARFDF
ncbi:TonB-dependent receptor [Parasphingorhabdus sp.]|uniref:TonB-dependent receptor n=1 Tax=Parasphingorhabdus sp. TaxID=2709688 RepID=UPI003A906F77